MAGMIATVLAQAGDGNGGPSWGKAVAVAGVLAFIFAIGAARKRRRRNAESKTGERVTPRNP